MSIFSSFFCIGALYLLNRIILCQYINFVYSNWDNHNQDNNFISHIANNNSLKSESKDFIWFEINLDNQDKFYNIYNEFLAVFLFLTSRLLPLWAFLTSDDFLFFFDLNSLLVKIVAALYFKFCIFFVILFRLFFTFSSIVFFILTAVYIFLASLFWVF